MDDKNNNFDDFTGYVAMVNSDNATRKGCGYVIPAIIAVLLILCLLSTCLSRWWVCYHVIGRERRNAFRVLSLPLSRVGAVWTSFVKPARLLL